jgi:GlpG protein
MTNGGLPRARQSNIPITIAIIVCSVVASLTSHFGSPRGSRDPGKTTLEQKAYYTLSFVDRRDYETSGDAFGSIRKGEIWRLITPMFLHGDELHLAFNMLWVFFLGSAIERLHGSIFLLVMVLITQSAGMMLQVMLPDASYIPESLRGSPFAIGASGAVYGLFGFLWLRPLIDKSYPVVLVPMNVAMMLGWLVLCLTPMGQNVANGAHLGGLVSGIAMALIGPWRRP